MRLYRTPEGPVVQTDDGIFRFDMIGWDELYNQEDIQGFLDRHTDRAEMVAASMKGLTLLPPIGNQEVWGAGVTYSRSREARMEESEDAGGGGFYEKVYSADRPELFPKAAAHRVAGQGQTLKIRSDSNWSVPEPELALAINAEGKIFGYTIGNDMSSRDIEGENPLYLPQAKVYAKSCSLGPGIFLSNEALGPNTEIRLLVKKGEEKKFEGKTTLAEMKRTPQELVRFLYQDNSFPHGAYLLTGAGVIPPSDFTLESGDEIRIAIEPIGTLVNFVG